MFAAKKILYSLIAPGNFLLLVALLGMLLMVLTRRRRLGAALMSLSVLVLAAVAVFPVGQALLAPLEDRFAKPDPMPASMDGVVVLGGYVDPYLSAQRGEPAVNDAVERILAGVALARRYPTAWLVVSGGTGSIQHTEPREAEAVRALLAGLGFSLERVVFERESRDTFENALRFKELLNPGPKQTWLLVTSSRHMPRAVGVFRRLGIAVTPYPVDYATTGEPRISYPPSLAGGLSALETAVHEWAGLAWYRLMGRSSELFPAPEPEVKAETTGGE